MGRSRGLRPAGPGGRRGRRAAALALTDPGAAAVQLANLATSESPIPVPGAWGDAVGPLTEGLEDRPADLGRTPGPSSSDRDRTPPSRAGHLEPDTPVGAVCPRGVHEQVLDDPLDLRRIDRDHDGIASATTSRPLRMSRLSTVRPREGADVGHAYCGSTMPRLSRFDVQQILQQPVELRCVLCQSPGADPRRRRASPCPLQGEG